MDQGHGFFVLDRFRIWIATPRLSAVSAETSDMTREAIEIVTDTI
jgi:hypothetical protein